VRGQRGGERGETQERQTANRLLGLAAAGLLWALLILCRLVYLQVVSHERYLELAQHQQRRTVTVQPERGAIFDRNGHPLAQSVAVDSVCINPLRVPDRPFAADILSRVLGVDRRDLLDKLEKAYARRSGFLWVKRRIPPEESERLRSLKLEWVEFRKETSRYYPNGSLASHVVGAVDYSQEQGNLGLEQSLDKVLRGRPGTVTMVTDVQQRGVDSIAATKADPGASVTLSIDERIQFIAERELAAACNQYKAASGSVVVMNPYTGELLAIASYPSFDPNQPPKRGDDPTARFDHPVSVPFEPGSVFKIVTLSAALETTDLRPESQINCGNGTIRLFGRVIHEAHGGYGVLSMADVLAKSSNIGAIQIGLRVGEKNLLEYVHRFGFGRRTGLPLPAESSGMVRDLKHWGKTSIGSVAMGHEISTTAVQLAQACSVIANGGVLVRPRLVLSRQKPGEPPVREPAEPPRRVLKPETAITMRQMMEGVVLHGTGKAARLPGYTSGGKTGSAQIFDLETKHYTHYYNGSFVGFAPVTNPAVVIAVTLNGTKLYGGVVAAPVFKAVATETLRLLEVPMDLPETAEQQQVLAKAEDAGDVAIADLSRPPDDLQPVRLSPAAPSAIPEQPAVQQAPGTVTVAVASGPVAPDFEGKSVRAVLKESVAKGVPVDIVGSGIARLQTPLPGTPLNPGGRVRVEFR
jgi:cell division protein FtsI (penicillin-binding protein 3)